MDVSDRRMQVQLTPEAKIASDFLFIRAIFAVVGFVSALSARGPKPFRAYHRSRRHVRRERVLIFASGNPISQSKNRFLAQFAARVF